MRIDINIDYLSISNRSNQCAATSVQQRLHKNQKRIQASTTELRLTLFIPVRDSFKVA